MSNESKEQSIYVGNGKTIGKDGLKISVCLSDLPKEHIQTSEKNGKKYINLVAFPYNEAKSWGTHSLKVDTWKPDKTKSTSQSTSAGEDDLPF